MPCYVSVLSIDDVLDVRKAMSSHSNVTGKRFKRMDDVPARFNVCVLGAQVTPR